MSAIYKHHPKRSKNCVFCKFWIGDAKMKFVNSAVGYEYDGNTNGKCTKRNGAATDLYAHMNTEDRRRLAQKMEQDFFQGSKQSSSDDMAQEDETTQAMRLLQKNPDMAKLIIAALGRSAGN